MGYVGGYSLHLYCDNPKRKFSDWSGRRCLMGEFGGKNRKEAFENAKLAGWNISSRKRGDIGTGECLCPSAEEDMP